MLSKVYKFKFLLALVLVPFLVSADPPGWDKTETLFSHVLTIPNGVTPTISGTPIETGDWVGVFFDDGGTLVCGGSIQYNAGVVNSFSAFGDDPTTPGVKDGFASGESFIWKIYDSSVPEEHFAEAEYDPASINGNDFVVFGSSTLSSLVAPTFAVSASATPSVLCSAQDVTLEGTLLAGGPVDEWNWYTGGVGGTLVGTGQTITLFVDETTTFTLEAIDDLLTATATVTVVGPPMVTAGMDADMCAADVAAGYMLSEADAANYLALSWATSGDGNFDNPNVLNPTYFPGPNDEANGSVTLTLTAVSADCGPVDASMTLTIVPEPSIDIIPDEDYACFGDPFDFTGLVDASDYESIQWFTTNGDGNFTPNETVLEPVYNPSPSIDYPQVCIIIGVAAAPMDPCTVSAEDFMDLCFVAPPEVDAGEDAVFCTDGLVDYTFDATVTFDPNWGGNIMWTTTGDGTFDDPTAEDPTYTFGPNDLSMTGDITFTVTAETAEACGPVSDEVVISTQLPPSIEIIPDAYTICEGEVMDFAGLVDADNYASLQWFTTNGDGFFTPDETVLEPVYNPSPSIDYPQGCIIIGVAASPIDPCTVAAEDFMDLCFQMLPVVFAGDPATICANETFTTDPTVENTVGPYEWTHNGAGYFEDPTLLQATYVADAGDGGNVVELTLTAQPISPCVTAISGSMDLTVLPAPYVDAGDDFTVCETENPELCGEAEFVSETMWATTGDGYFCCPEDLCPVTYYPGPNDLANGCVTLVLIGYPLEPCSLYELDKVVVCFDPAPMVDAGPDMTICEDATAQLAGMEEHTCGLQWVTFDGTGTFSDETILDPVYTPSFQDVISGTVHLILIGSPCGECTEPAMDTMALTIQRNPVVDAGEDKVVCEDASIALDDATADYYSSLMWTGNVDDPTALNPIYTPTPDDIAAGFAELCLTAEPIGPCTVSATDCVMIDIQLNPSVDILPDQDTICFGDVYDFAGKVVYGNYSAIQWFTTNGDGFFTPNETVEFPVYNPSPSIDYPQGCIEIGVAVSPIDPCTVGDEDFMTLCFQPPIELEVEGQATICEDATIQPEMYIITLENNCGVMWSSDGDGTWDDASMLDAIYTPGPDDISSGSFTITLTALGCSTCDDVSATIDVSIQYLPEAYAGEDDVTCAYLCQPPCPPYVNGEYTLDMATVANSCGQYWETLGDGTFDDPMALNPTYTLGAGDIAAGFVELCLTAEPCDPCTLADTDCMILTVQPFPTADAGPDVTICEGDAAQLDGTATNHSGVFWDFALLGEGDGTFSNQIIDDPEYYPGPEDIDRGYVELVFVAFPINPCIYPDADVMTVYITPQPIAFAGEDGTICAGETYDLADAYVEDATGGVIWTTSGDGVFVPGADVVNPTYEPGPDDIAAGSVDLCLEAFDGPECSGQYIDCMTLTILPPPVVDAGPDATICCYETFELVDATASNVSSVMWTSNGTGTFDDATLVNPTYDPSEDDCAAGVVELCIEGMPLDPCTLSASDCMELTINAEPDANICFNGEVAGYADTFEFCYDETVEVTLCEILAGTGPFEVCYTVNAEPEVCVTVDEGGVIFSGILDPGTYEIALTSMTDANGCENQNIGLYTATVIINPEPVAAFCVNGDLAATGSVFEYCFDTEVDVTLCDIVEGDGPFEVCWTVNGGPEECATVDEGESLFTDLLAPGTYDVQVTSITDANGCSVSAAVLPDYMLTVIIYPEPAVGFCVNGDLADTGEYYEFCYDTEVDVTLCEVWSGDGPFEVCYTVNAEPEVCVTVNQGESLFTDFLDPGDYHVEVTSITDVHGCMVEDVTPYTLDVTILPEPFLVFAFNGVQVAPGFTETYCEDTPVVVTLDEIWAGCSPFEVCYEITKDGAPYETDCVSVAATGDELYNSLLDPGFYEVTVTSLTDACGCVASQATLNMYTAEITIQALPTIDPIDDYTLCVTEEPTYCIDATAANYSSLMWTTTGSGTFDDATIEDPCYTPSADDIGLGSVDLCLTAEPIDPCTVSAEECFTLTLQEGPTASTGGDATICEDVCYTFADATFTNYDALMWYTLGGDGTFDDETIENPEYCPGMMDIANGSVEICVIAAPISPCTIQAEDCMTLTIQWNATIDPLDDVTICETDVPYCIDATAANYSSLSWSTSGTGTFDTPTEEDACYSPSMDDIGTGSVELCLTAEPIDPCQLSVTECFILTFQYAPTVEPLADATICEDDVYCFDATAANYSSLMWSGGNGFDDPAIEDPCYTPTADDILAGSVELCLTAEPIGPCTVAAEECMTLTIQGLPTVDVGTDITVCDNILNTNEPYVTVCATATNYSSIEWSSPDGTGFFDPEFGDCTDYYPSTDDVIAGQVTLCATALPIDPCTISAEDCMTLFFDPSPEAFAGDDDVICEGDTYNFADAVPMPFANDYSSLEWTTAGDGTFDDPTAITPIYTPGPNDIANAGVELCLTAYPTGGCTVADEDCMFLEIVPNPVIEIDPEIWLECADYNLVADGWDPVEACATVSFADAVQWSTSGDGTFADPAAACTEYTLGPNDKWAQMITLTIEATGPGACQAVTVATVDLYIPSQLIQIEEPAPAWQGISSYLDKSMTEVPEVMYPVVGDPPGTDNLIIMINKDGDYYWPFANPPQNKIGDWSAIGYKAKFQMEDCLYIFGDTLADQTFFIDGSFTYLPVLTNVVVPIADVGAQERLFFTDDQWNDILFILDWTTGQLISGFGPIAANALTELVPGRGYLFVKNDPANEFTVEFPDFDPAGSIFSTAYYPPADATDNNSIWNDVVKTGNPHALFFTEEVLGQIKVGDIIGAFDASGQCVGMTEIANRNVVASLLAYGDDPVTEAIDGFQVGENMNFKLYRPETGETFDVTFTYDPEFPSYDNQFTIYGASKVVDITMNATSIGDLALEKDINVYPNPANEVINIASDYNMKKVTLVNYVGQTVFTQEVQGNDYQINVSNYVTGMYFVRIETTNGSVVTKRITIE